MKRYAEKWSILNINHKKLRNLFILFLLAVCSGCHPGQTVLKGHIENYCGQVVRICSERQVERRDTLRVDSLGHFACTLADAGIYEISVKDHMPWVPVYVGQGDRVKVKLALRDDKQIDAQFSGDRTAENTYLWAYCEAKNRKFWNRTDLQGVAFSGFQVEIEGMRKALQPLLEQVKDKKVREELAVRQHLMLREHLLNYAWLQGGEKEPDADYEAFAASINLKEANERILGSVIGWYLSKAPVNREEHYLVIYLKVLAEKVTNQQMLDEHATQQVRSPLRYFSGNLDDVFAEYNRIVKNDSLRQAVNAEYAEYLRAFDNLMPGKVAPDFEMVDVAGNKCRLSDLRGKYLFIDFWATWCAPCREEIPHMAELQKHFAKDKRIALISISVDANRNVWKKFLEKDQPAWKQYNVDKKTNEFLDKEYRIYGIPHFMLLDPESRFINYSFTRPSDPDCASMIEEAMK